MMAKLYGLPRNTDVACIYYNQKMFEDNQWDVPETYDELLELAGKNRLTQNYSRSAMILRITQLQ